MSREDLQRILDESTKDSKVYSFYIRIKDGGISSNIWGKFSEFDEKTKDLLIPDVKGDLPIEMLVLYFNYNSNVWIKNPEYDILEMGTWESHICINVPYIGMNGDFFFFEEFKNKIVSKHGEQ